MKNITYKICSHIEGQVIRQVEHCIRDLIDDAIWRGIQRVVMEQVDYVNDSIKDDIYIRID